jgi:hypothetical protein
MDQRLPAAEDEWMEQSTRRPDRPLWVQVALWGLPSRASVWVCFWLSFILTVASISYGFVDVRFFAGGLFLFAALWYYLAIRWIDRHDRW